MLAALAWQPVPRIGVFSRWGVPALAGYVGNRSGCRAAARTPPPPLSERATAPADSAIEKQANRE
ncbi:hypothetical protein [Sphingomonas leidyi]|jgi:hypothetical protein|uniref:hypothetical protein n=1 Tax=Sphingomonas leidyi TaxID=68569 RepID=UPI0036D37780